MDRLNLTFAALKPLDLALDAGMKLLEATAMREKISDSFYESSKRVIKEVFERLHDIEVEGLENVPAKGGVIFACNHQSWADVQMVGLGCPRRLHFLAKAEFQDWPVLRHLIDLSASPYIKRGGDSEGLKNVVELLHSGRCVVIFPEGTIPGEEDRMRHHVEPNTGLLRGHTGAVRLAVEAKVPIIPVGISGTGKVLPPEVFPRLELFEAPKSGHVTVRFGTPIQLDSQISSENRKVIRKETDELMKQISTLVDHKRGYVPTIVPKPELPQYERLGALVLHGFTGSVKTVNGIIPTLEKMGIETELPVLRGHGTHYKDMKGVGAQDWYDDAEAALLRLSERVDKVIVVGLSMGGLVALNLGIRHRDKIAGIVTWGAALRFQDPLAGVAPMLGKLPISWPSPAAFNDKSLASTSENYPRFMTDAFASLYAYAKETEERLSQLELPICVLQSKKDQVVAPIAANVIYRDVSSKHREIHWFEKSGHEMGQDLEREKVFETTCDFIGHFLKKAGVQSN